MHNSRTIKQENEQNQGNRFIQIAPLKEFIMYQSIQNNITGNLIHLLKLISIFL